MALSLLPPNAPPNAAGLSRDWQQEALCRSDNAEVFFPPLQFEPKADREVRESEAKAICARCPVLADCRAWALATREPHGIWGGMTELERKQALHQEPSLSSLPVAPPGRQAS